MAKDLARTRRQKQKFYELRSQLQAVNLRLQTVKSTQSMVSSLKGIENVMSSINKQTNLPELQRVLEGFKRQSEALSFSEEVMSDAISDVMAEESDEEAEEEIVQKIIDEIRVDLSEQLAEGPPVASLTKMHERTAVPTAEAVGNSRRTPAKTTGARVDEKHLAAMADIENDIDARLERLRNHDRGNPPN
eukprot:Polyplicarium_translucidae@DN2550_c0_g1_i2.p2